MVLRRKLFFCLPKVIITHNDACHKNDTFILGKNEACHKRLNYVILFVKTKKKNAMVFPEIHPSISIQIYPNAHFSFFFFGWL